MLLLVVSSRTRCEHILSTRWLIGPKVRNILLHIVGLLRRVTGHFHVHMLHRRVLDSLRSLSELGQLLLAMGNLIVPGVILDGSVQNAHLLRILHQHRLSLLLIEVLGRG